MLKLSDFASFESCIRHLTANWSSGHFSIQKAQSWARKSLQMLGGGGGWLPVNMIPV